MADGARIRLRSIKWKDGRAPVRVFRTPDPSTEISDEFASTARSCVESTVGGAKMTAWAMVAWAASGDVFVAYRNGDRSGIPGGSVGQYAKDILDTEQAIRWSRE